MLARAGSLNTTSDLSEPLASCIQRMCEALKLALNAGIVIVDLRPAAVAHLGGGRMTSNVRYSSDAYSDAYLLRLSDPLEVAEECFASFACVPIRDEAGSKLGSVIVRLRAKRAFGADDVMAMKKISGQIAAMLCDALRHFGDSLPR
jgi:GAF domain-containing protein